MAKFESRGHDVAQANPNFPGGSRRGVVEQQAEPVEPIAPMIDGATISWRAILAGVVTFLSVTIILSLVTLGIGLDGASLGAGIWGIIALAIALAAGGFMSGSVALRSGLAHGFLTFATSLIVTLGLTVWLSASLLGAVGGIAGSVAEAFSGTDATKAVEEVQDSTSDNDLNEAQQKADDAMDDAKNAASDAADTAQTSSWWAFAGLLVGAAISTGAGSLGVRTLATKRTDM